MIVSFILAPCPDPGAPVNGRMRNIVNLRHNSLVQFVCDDGYQLDDIQWIRCVDGSWSDSVPKCIGKIKKENNTTV